MYSHSWTDASSLLGYAQPEDIEEVAAGLYVKMSLDLTLPWAKAVYSLLQQDALQWSIGYTVPASGDRKASDGAVELTEIDLFECGPCLKGVNPDMQTISVKGGTLDLRTGRILAVGTVEQRKAAEKAIADPAASEGITFEAERQAEAARKAEEHRAQHTLLSSAAVQTAKAMRRGDLDEMIVSPTGTLKPGPIRKAQIEAEEARERAIRQAEREQREREQARAEAIDAATRRSGPHAGGHRVAKVTS